MVWVLEMQTGVTGMSRSTLFSKDELTFFDRMAFHTAHGLSFDDAARQVIADDTRIRGELFDRRCSLETQSEQKEMKKLFVHRVWTGCRAAT